LSKGFVKNMVVLLVMEYPKLRPVEAIPAQNNMICLRDPQGFSDKLLLIPQSLLFIISRFDGKHTVLDIQAEYTRSFGELLFSDKVRQIIDQLDDALFLESERFQQAQAEAVETFRAASVREAAHAGVSYEAQAEALRNQLEAPFAPPDGPGLPDAADPSGRLRGLIAPHIDLRRGARCFAWSYAELARECSARTFLLLGIVHGQTKHPFVLTSKDFKTPLGVVSTDREFLEALGARCRTDFYEDEFCHRGEHSIEFQILFLQYLYEGDERLRIVPVLCSLPPELYQGGSIAEDPEIGEFIEALSKTVKEAGSEVCCIAAVDLSHIGQRFGQNVTMQPSLLEQIEREDRRMIATILSGEAEAFFRGIQEERDRRNVCGVPAIYTLLRILEADNGRLLRYEQAVDAASQSVVSFMAGAFYC
jgi:AmmeMemoRadiSam system protein B